MKFFDIHEDPERPYSFRPRALVASLDVALKAFEDDPECTAHDLKALAAVVAARAQIEQAVQMKRVGDLLQKMVDDENAMLEEMREMMGG